MWVSTQVNNKSDTNIMETIMHLDTSETDIITKIIVSHTHTPSN